MIEKLDIKNGGVEDLLNCIKKINEVVDVVNAMQNLWIEVATVKKIILELQTRSENVQTDTESRSENVQDPYAEQRKWIGKLCWFWDDDKKDGAYGVLGYIKEGWKRCYVQKGHYFAYEHCEPVSEDLIYKGGDNE